MYLTQKLIIEECQETKIKIKKKKHFSNDSENGNILK